MDPDETRRPWAADGFELARTVGRSVHPLLLLGVIQFAWVVHVALLSCVSSALSLDGRSLEVGSLYVIGAAVLLGGWALGTGLLRALWLPLSAILHRLILLLGLLIPGGLGILAGAALFVATYLRTLVALLAGRWFMSRSRMSAIRLQPSFRGMGRLSLRRAEIPTTRFMEQYLDPLMTRVKAEVATRGAGGRLLVALPPAETHEHRVLAGPGASVHYALAAAEWPRSLRPLEHEALPIQLTDLPAITSPRSAHAARAWRALLGGDVLVWCRFSPDPSQVWAFLAPRETAPLPDEDLLFPMRWNLSSPPVVAWQWEDPDEASLLLLLATTTLIEGRTRRGAWLLPRLADRLDGAFDSHQEALAEALLRSLPQPEGECTRASPPSVTEWAAELSSAWIGCELTTRGDLSDELHVTRLVDALEKVLILRPHEAVDLYRYGTLLCLVGEPDSAMNAFNEAAARRTTSNPEAADRELAAMEIELSDIPATFPERQLVLARAATRAAFAAHVLGTPARRRVREVLDRQGDWTTLEEYRESTGLTVLEELATPVEHDAE